MDGNDWANDGDQSFAAGGGQQQYYNGGNARSQSGNQLQLQNIAQQQQQQYQPVLQHLQGVQQPPFGHYPQQQQFGGQQFLNGSQQQQQPQQQAQQFARQDLQAQGGQQSAMPGQSFQGGQSSVGGQSTHGGQFVSGGQQLQPGRLPFQVSFDGQQQQQQPQQPNMPTPYIRHTLYDGSVTYSLPWGVNLPGQQATTMPPTRGPSGQQQSASNGQSSRQSSSSGGSFSQQILPRQRALGGLQQPVGQQQQYMGGGQQIPMALGGPSRQSLPHFNGAQQQYSANASSLSPLTAEFPMGGQQKFMDNASQFSPLTAHFPIGVQQQQIQSGQLQFMSGQRQPSGHSQQLSPTAAEFQPSLLQQVAAGALNLNSQQGQDVWQSSAIGQQFSPSAAQFQPGAQQHFANNQSNSLVSQYQSNQHFPPGQIGQNSQSLLQAASPFQQTLGSNQSYDGQQNTASQQVDFMHQPLGYDSQLMDQMFDSIFEEGNAYNFDDDGVQVDSAQGDGQGDHTEHHQGATHQAGQRLEQDITDNNDNIVRPVPEDMMVDPLYQQTLLQVQEWQRQNNVPMTQDQQSRLAAAETRKKKENCKGGKRLAELDEDDIDDDMIEEAVRVQKRQRVRREQLNFHANARKVYVQGPENRPEPMDIDGSPNDEYQVTSYDLDLEILGCTPEFKGEFSGATLSFDDSPFKKPYEHQLFDRNFRLIESICCDWSFMIEVTKHLRVKDIVMLYSISKTFHDLVNLRFQSTIAAWAQEISPSGWKVFYWKFYGSLCIRDPAGKPWAMPGPVAIPRPPWARPQRVISSTDRARSVPSLKYLAMIAQRETRTRDIVACLARAGHRLPETMHVTLKKMWMLMDIHTNRLRRSFIRNKDIWTARDLYNAQMFYVKLQMRFNEPIFGPKATILADTFLGLRCGLNPLWRLLRKKDYLHGEQVLQQRLRYFCRDSVIQHHLLIGEPYVGIHPYELGNEHKEGWGLGKVHLSRPDELVVEESVRRCLRMDKHLVFMVFWGHVDWKKRMNLVPTEEEMYMSDDELPPLPKTGNYAANAIWGKCGNVPFEFDNWQPKHAMKARWKELKREEKLAIIKDDGDEQMRALPFEKDVHEKFWDLPYNANDIAHPDYPDGNQTSPEESDDEDVDTEMGEADDDDEDGEDSGSEDSGLNEEVNNDQIEDEVMRSASAKAEEEKNVTVEYKYSFEDESLPLPHNIDDIDVIAYWYDLDPWLQQKIIDEQDRIDKSITKDSRTLAIIFDEDLKKAAKAGAQKPGESSTTTTTSAGPSHRQSRVSFPSPYTSPTKKKPKRYQYPGITDPIALSLLEKYDRFDPEDFCTDKHGNIRRGEPVSSSSGTGGSSSSSSEDTNRHVVELSDYDEYDDDELKALADEDYDAAEIDFDLDAYQKFLERIGDDGGFQDPDAGDSSEEGGKGRNKKKKKKKRDVKGKGKAIAVESSDGEDDYDGDEMAYEGDLVDDLALPSYDFRRY